MRDGLRKGARVIFGYVGIEIEVYVEVQSGVKWVGGHGEVGGGRGGRWIDMRAQAHE